MKYLSAIAVTLLLTANTFAQKLPIPSPPAKVFQTVGLTELEINYSRPGAKGREVWEELVPVDAIWRTGANKSTLISFNTEVFIGDEDVEKGTYSLFTMFHKNNEVTVYLNSDIEGWGKENYEEANNVVEFKTKWQKDEVFHENMVFYFDDITSGSANIYLSWAGRKVIIPIRVDFIGPSVANIDMKIRESDEPDFRVYKNAAAFYLENEMEPEKALEYASKSVELEEHFWNVYTLSEAYAVNGDFKNAIKYAKKSMALAKEANYEPYVKKNQDNIDRWEKM